MYNRGAGKGPAERTAVRSLTLIPDLGNASVGKEQPINGYLLYRKDRMLAVC